jgi:hypothetical protein
MEHAPYSPDPASSDYHMFGPLKKFLAGQWFISDNMKTTVRQWFHAQPTEFYNSGTSKLAVRWDKFLNRGGDCGIIVRGTCNTACILISLYVYYCG